MLARPNRSQAIHLGASQSHPQPRAPRRASSTPSQCCALQIPPELSQAPQTEPTRAQPYRREPTPHHTDSRVQQPDSRRCSPGLSKPIRAKSSPRSPVHIASLSVPPLPVAHHATSGPEQSAAPHLRSSPPGSATSLVLTFLSNPERAGPRLSSAQRPNPRRAPAYLSAPLLTYAQLANAQLNTPHERGDDDYQ